MRPPVIKSVSDAIQAAVDFVMPIACVHCGVEGALLCERCVEGSPKLPANVCYTCADPTSEHMTRCGDCAALPPPLDRLIAVYRYGGAARSAVHALKYRHIKAIAPVMADLMSLHPFPRRVKLDCVVPVPVHADRLRERGYNQASLLAGDVADNLHLKFLAQALIKTRATVSQVELSRQERAMSLRGAFTANFRFDDAHVLLVDDVCTTGNTLMNCAAALKRAGARRVSAMIFAKEALETRADVAISEPQSGLGAS